MNGFPWFVDDAPVKQFRDVMTKYNLDQDCGNPNVTAMWASLELFRKAMASASDSPTSAEVFDAMYKLKDETLDGLLPQKLTYTKGEPAPVINCFWTYKLDNGVFSALSGGLTPSCFP